MNIIKKAILFLLLIPYTFSAQMAGSFIHKQVADSIKDLFNTRQFKEIYTLTTPGFKEAIQEKEVVELLESGLYTPLGKIEDIRPLREDTGFYVFLMDFKEAKVQMNLGVNELRQVAYLQLLPYHEISMTKRVNYASDNKKQTALDSLVDRSLVGFMQSPQNCGISIGISQGGANYFYNYGEPKRDSRVLPTPQTVYEIGSMTKTFCGILLAHAVTERKIKLDGDIRNYLPGDYPGLAFKGAPVLIKHLANHTSGLPSIPSNLTVATGFDSLNPYKHYPKQMLFDYLKTVTLTVAPGTICDYSNTGMALLGLILEGVYGKSFETLVKEKICVPNNMHDTGIRLSSEQSRRFAEGYNEEGDHTPYWDLGDFAAAGGLRSSTSDLLAYLAYNLKEQDAVAKLAHQCTYNSRENVGLAWFIKKTKQGNTLLWHNGGTFGFSGFMGFVREKNATVIILTNSGTNVDYIGIAILNYLQQ